MPLHWPPNEKKSIIIKKIIVHTTLPHNIRTKPTKSTNQPTTYRMREKKKSKNKVRHIHYIIHTIWTYPSYLHQNWSWLASAKLIRRNIYSALFCSPASRSAKHKMKMNRIVWWGKWNRPFRYKRNCVEYVLLAVDDGFRYYLTGDITIFFSRTHYICSTTVLFTLLIRILFGVFIRLLSTIQCHWHRQIDGRSPKFHSHFAGHENKFFSVWQIGAGFYFHQYLIKHW